MERMPCGQSVANSDPSLATFSDSGQGGGPANRVYLKVCRGLNTLFDEIRLRIWEFAKT